VSLPGADGEDERRGSFSGSAEDLTQLIFQVASKLKLSRLTLCCHSFGSIVGRNFAHAFPALVEGFINLGGTMSYWSFGMTMIYKLMIYDNKYHEEAWRSQRLYEKDGEREKLYEKYARDYKEKKYAEYGLPFYAKFEYFIFLKAHSYPPTHLDHSYGVYSALPILKLTIYAKDDRIFLPERAEATLYDYLFNPHSFTQSPAFRSLLRTARPAVEARLR
jgi:pimeloyl-ACP methyl ester carboxylesterase